MADTTMDPSLFAYLKSVIPDVRDDDIVKGYGEAETALQAQGKSMKDLPLPQLASSLKAAITAAGQPPAQSVEVTGKRPTPDAQIAAMPGPAGQAPQPTAASQDALYAGSGPTATRLNTSDPAALEAAQKALYEKQGGNNGLYRFMSGIGAATREGLGGQAGAMEANRKFFNDLDTANTTGLVKSKQDLASKGLGDANAALSTAGAVKTQADKLEMDKKQFILDMQTKGLNLEQQQKAWDEVGSKLFDVNGPLAKITQDLASKALGVDAKSLAGLSPAELAGVIQHAKPVTELQNQAQTQLQNIFNGLTARIGTNAAAAANYAQARSTNLGTDLVKNATKNGTELPAGLNLAVSAGPASLQPSPAVTGQQVGAADIINKMRAQTQTFLTSGISTAIDTAMSRLGDAKLLDTGVMGQQLAKLGVTDAAGIKSAISSYYQAEGMDPKAADAQADSIFNMTPARATAALAAIKAANQTKLIALPKMEEHVKKNGNFNGFKSPAMRQFYNPKTGDVIVSDDPKDVAPAGYKPIAGVK